ncbi:hypothetical protein [Anabaena azotica]|uniref:Uncharacterized protein n=1 Tax=Anabaena azotica FACHB-119 TaxID=947527 RepID=A0ABR8D277_9NOST|nr:hypothetical protein [Anabaena azotica]MBD2501280.1 hypothetical protein [Anabaena azotica FACHB-119]
MNGYFYYEQDLRKCHNWLLVRDATSLMTTFKYYRQSHTLQKKYASCVSPNELIFIVLLKKRKWKVCSKDFSPYYEPQ